MKTIDDVGSTTLMMPTAKQDQSTGVITVDNFCINRNELKYITIQFRDVTGKDDIWINKLDPETSEISTDWIMLSRLCIKWGDDDTVTSLEFVSDAIPYSHLRYLRKVVMGYLFPNIEDSKR